MMTPQLQLVVALALAGAAVAKPMTARVTRGSSELRGAVPAKHQALKSTVGKLESVVNEIQEHSAEADKINDVITEKESQLHVAKHKHNMLTDDVEHLEKTRAPAEEEKIVKVSEDMQYSLARAGKKRAEDKTTVTDVFQRVWFACKGTDLQVQSPEEKAAGIKVANPMKCTDEMPFKGLCCAEWTDDKFKHVATLELEDQGSPCPEEEEEAVANAGEVIKLCTQAVFGSAMLRHSGASAAVMPVECFSVDVPVSDELLLGELFLRQRILFFAHQGIQVDCVPTCAAEVTTCPDGTPPHVVNPDWLQNQRSTQNGTALLESVDSRSSVDLARHLMMEGSARERYGVTEGEIAMAEDEDI